MLRAYQGVRVMMGGVAVSIAERRQERFAGRGGVAKGNSTLFCIGVVAVETVVYGTGV